MLLIEILRDCSPETGQAVRVPAGIIYISKVFDQLRYQKRRQEVTECVPAYTTDGHNLLPHYSTKNEAERQTAYIFPTPVNLVLATQFMTILGGVCLVLLQSLCKVRDSIVARYKIQPIGRRRVRHGFE